MKKTIIIAILIGITILSDTKVMASGAAYTTYMIEQMKIEKATGTQKKSVAKKNKENPALMNRR